MFLSGVPSFSSGINIKTIHHEAVIHSKYVTKQCLNVKSETISDRSSSISQHTAKVTSSIQKVFLPMFYVFLDVTLTPVLDCWKVDLFKKITAQKLSKYNKQHLSNKLYYD